MKTLGYYNGKIDLLENMSVPMLDRACYFGDGVYDVTFSRNYRIFALNEHINNLFRSAAAVQIHPSISHTELKKLLEFLVRKMDCGENRIYMQLSRGTALRAHHFPASGRTNLWIMISPGSIRDPYKPMKCITRPDTRFLHCNVKSLNLLPNVLASQAAEQSGNDECILHRGETVTECAHSNIMILKRGIIITHPADEQIYAGTGRAHFLNLCRKVGIPVEERYFSLQEMKKADEILITSASVLCGQVTEVNGIPIGNKAQSTVRALQDALVKTYYRETAL